MSARAPGAAVLTSSTQCTSTYLYTSKAPPYILALSARIHFTRFAFARTENWRSSLRRRVDHGETGLFLDDGGGVGLLQVLPHPFRAAGRNVRGLQLWTHLLLLLQRERCAYELKGGRCNGILLSDLRGPTSFQQTE